MSFTLEVDKVEAGYSRVPILNGVSLKCRDGWITAIIGPNGCGKSTLLKAIIGLIKPTGGSVHFNGRDITGLPPEKLLLEGIALVPQARSTFPRMTVEENLRLGGYLQTDDARLKQRLAEIYEMFPRLKERRTQLAGTMSGGEQRILELGRSMVLSPKLLLLDEPSAMLAPALLESLFETIVSLKEHGATVLIVEQNIKKVFEICDYVYVLDYGRNHLDGTPEHCRNQPELSELYMG